jgi:hypothetical protein
MANRFQTSGNAIPIRPSRFANDIQQLFGDDLDLDPLFLEESWTFGAPIALENLRRRRQAQAERECQSRAFRELDTLGTLFFVENREPAGESLLADRAATIASGYGATWSPRAAQTAAPARDTQQSWTPKDWAPEDRIAQSWMPEDVPQHNAGSQQMESIAQPWDNMTLARARQLLGTSAASTREQIRSAYRRMVSQWHPDRLQHASEAVHERATQQMAAINEAYRLLCPTQQCEAA